MENNVFEQIRQEYYELTAAEKKTADYVMSHHAETQFLSIAELAEASGVAEATVSRFCRRMGYKGYNAFKLAIANATAVQNQDSGIHTGQALCGDRLEDICQQLYHTDTGVISETLSLIRPEAIRAAAALLASANKVLCMGQGGSMIMAQEAAHLFSTVSGKFFPVSDSHMQITAAANMSPDDTLLFFSYSGSTWELMDTLRVASERKAHIILITRFPKSPGAALAEIVLRCGSNESPLQLGSVAARIAQLFLLDVLFQEFCCLDMEGCDANRSRVAAALADKHL